MKKGGLIPGIFIASVSSISMAAAAVLPAPAQLPGYISNQLSFGKISGFFSDLLIGGSGTEIVTRLLLVMLLTAVLFRPAYNLLGKKSGIAFIVAFLVSVLGIRFFPSGGIEFLLLPYGTLAVAASALLPFLLFGYFLEMGEPKIPATLRKIAWVCIIVAFLFLWDMRYPNLGDASYIYIIMALCSVALLFLDGTIQRALLMSKMKSANAQSAWNQISQLQSDINLLNQQLANAISQNQPARIINGLKRQIAAKNNAISHMYKNFTP